MRLALPTDLNATLNLLRMVCRSDRPQALISLPCHQWGADQYFEEHGDFQKWRAQHTNGKTMDTTPYALAPTGRAAARE